MDRMLQMLRDCDALRDCPNDTDRHAQQDRVVSRTVPGMPPTFCPEPLTAIISSGLAQALDSLGFSKLYEHQAAAIRYAVAGKDVVLEAPTASGKTLSFLVPLLHRLTIEPGARALLIYPMKALAHDQHRQLLDLTDRLPNRTRPFEVRFYDGDVSKEERSVIRDNPPDILITNPDMLQASFLGHADLWISFLKSLRYIVVDEIHEYRGYFGGNVALLMRRFLAKLKRLGAQPQLFLSTATCANPEEHARNLTGRAPVLVKATGAMRPERAYHFIAPDVADFKFQDIFRLRIARAALACLKQDYATLVFCPSRTFAERAACAARQDAPKYGLDPETIMPYRSGYNADDRRGIENGMRNGQYKLVFSTNALEIGIDVGRLDACILAGFPDNVMSAWQRIGRVGRSCERLAHVLFYAMNNVHDQFFAANMDVFLDRPLDVIALGHENEVLLQRHVPFLLNDINWRMEEGDRAILGDAFWQPAKELCETQRPMKGGMLSSRYAKLDMRGSGDTVYTLRVGRENLGTISGAHRFREAYLGAVYRHLGHPYRVSALSANDEIQVELIEHGLKTDGIFFTSIVPKEIQAGRRHATGLALYYGKLAVTEIFNGFKLVDEHTGAVIEEKPCNECRSVQAHGFWLTFEDASTTTRPDLAVGLRVLEQLLRIGFGFVIPSDRHDVATHSEAGNADRAPGVYLYETVPGGIGLAEKAFHVWPDIVQAGIRIAEACECATGCPRCIHPPRHRDADLLDKRIGLPFARECLNLADINPDTLDPDTMGWADAAQKQTI